MSIVRHVDAVTLTYADGKADGFYTDNVQSVRSILEKHGVCVYAPCLSDAECTAMNDGAAATFAWLTNGVYSVDDPSSYEAPLKLGLHHGGLVQHHQVAHAEYVYNVRQNPKVVEVFAELWQTLPTELLSSIDGVTYHTGASVFDPAKAGYALHLDQGFGPDSKGIFRCVQGLVTANDINAGDGTFRCLLGSHHHHGAYADAFGYAAKDSPKNWHVVARDSVTPQLQWYFDKGCTDLCVTVPRGGMVLWDSRTVHSGIQPLQKHKAIRNVVYTCYVPRGSGFTEAQRRKRLDIFTNPESQSYHRTCCHYPHPIRMFSKFPAFGRGKDGRWPTKEQTEAAWSNVPPMPDATHVLTPLGKRVMGID